MEPLYKYTEINGKLIAELITVIKPIATVQEALDLMADAMYQGADSLIFHENHLSPAFFDLKTRLAGDILQKFSTYRVRLAIVGDYEKYSSRSLKDFIYESNKMGWILFTANVEESLSRLSS